MPEPLFGIDVSSFQEGIDMGEVAREGFVFAFCKATQGASYVNPAFDDQYGGAKAAGLISAPYHYLTTEPIRDQIANLCRKVPAGTGIALDAENGSGDLSNIRAFCSASAAARRPVVLLYLPQWYWSQIDSPSLSGLPALWSSKYPTTNPAPASVLYQGVPQSYWNGYGGGNVAVLQFADSAQVAGRQVDASAFLGSRDQLAALLGGGGAPDMQLTDTFTDWAGNQQRFVDWMNHVDQRLAVLFHDFEDPGSEQSRIPGDTNKTNLRDMIMDSGSWNFRILQAVASLAPQDPQKVADAIKPGLVAAVGSIVQTAVQEALGADHTTEADAIVQKIAERLAAATPTPPAPATNPTTGN